MSYTKDGYGVVFNSDDTYAEAAKDLNLGGSVVLGWTEQQGTHMDVLLSLPSAIGPSNRLDNNWPKLFVGVVGKGLYAFSVSTSELHPNYIAEKLGFDSPNVTAVALTELINGVLKALDATIVRAL